MAAVSVSVLARRRFGKGSSRRMRASVTNVLSHYLRLLLVVWSQKDVGELKRGSRNLPNSASYNHNGHNSVG